MEDCNETNKLAVRHEMLRRAIEVSTSSMVSITNAKVTKDNDSTKSNYGLLEKLQESAIRKLQVEIDKV